jgi:hypothetical protein
MGNQQSATSVKNSVTDIVNKNMLNSFTHNLNEQSSQCSGSQDAEIITGPGSEVIGCDMNINQKMTLDCKSQAYFALQNENTLKADIQNSLDQSFKSDQKQENPSLTLVPYSSQNSSDTVNVQNYIKNIVERNLTTENLNKCLAIAKSAQQGKVTILGKYTCREGQGINLTQDMLLQQYAQCSSDIVNKTITDDSFVNKVVTKAVSSQSNLTSGYGAIIGIIIILLIVGVVLYFRFAGSRMAAASSSPGYAPPQVQYAPPQVQYAPPQGQYAPPPVVNISPSPVNISPSPVNISPSPVNISPSK